MSLECVEDPLMGKCGEIGITWTRKRIGASYVVSVDFTGEYEHRLDDRGRLAIPAAYRTFFEHGGFLLPGPDGQIELYTPDGYHAEKQVRTVGDKRRPSARRLARSFFGRVRRVEIDRQGRILIPPQMREERNLDGATVIVGMGEYLEIWSAETWQTEQAEIDEAYAELLQDLADLVDNQTSSEEA